MTDDQIEWFNALPIRQTGVSITEFERTCPCGSSVRYESPEQISVRSFVDVHFGHRAEELPKIPYQFEYDFERPIRFSRVGFHHFALGYKLEQVFPPLPKNFQAFTDANKKVFVFYMNYLDKKSITDAPELYATFYPSVSQ